MREKRTGHLLVVAVAAIICTCLLVPGAMHSARAKKLTVAATDGPALYGSNCAICHGRNGAGTPAWRAKGQPDLSSPDWQKSHSDVQIASQIKNGKGKMPAFGKKFSDDDIMALVKQVRSLKGKK